MKSYVELVSEILKHEAGEVVASPSLIMQLLSVYSRLYLGGRAPGICGKCHKEYYFKLKSTGMEKAKQADEAKNRTLELKMKTGLLYAGKPFMRHFNLETLTDAEAVKLLDAGIMKPEDFVKLPGAVPQPAVPGKEPIPTPVAKPRKRKK